MLAELARKEALDLARDIRIWVSTLATVAFFIGYSFVMRAYVPVPAGPEGFKVEVVYTGDPGPISAFDSALRSVLGALNFTTAPPHSFPKGADALLIVNASSVESLLQGGLAQAYLVYRSSPALVPKEALALPVLTEALSQASRLYVASSANISPQAARALLSPAAVATLAYYPHGNSVAAMDEKLLARTISAQYVLVIAAVFPLALLLSFSSASMAAEVEGKTLEVLLTMPVPRIYVVVAKLAGMALVGGVMAALMIAGLFANYQTISGFIETGSAGPAQIQGVPGVVRSVLEARLGSFSTELPILSMGPPQLLTFLAYYLEAFIFVGVVGIVLGGLIGDTRTAQAASGSLIPVVFLSAFISLYADPASLPPWTTLANPLTGHLFYLRMVISGISAPEIPAYLASSTLITILAIYASSKAVSLEALLRLRRGAARIFRRRGPGAGAL